MLRNKIKISIGLILLTLFCSFSIFSQVDEQSLHTEFIDIYQSNFGAYNTITQGLIIKEVETENGKISYVIERPTKFEKLLSKLLPKNSSIKTDEKGKYLIVTESKDRLRLFKEFIETLKKLPKNRICGYTALRRKFDKEYQAEIQEGNRIITEIIETHNIFSVNDSNSQKNWVKSQEKLARIILEDLDTDFNLVTSGLEVTTTKRKMDFVKNIIALFDKQILEEE